MEKRQIPWRRLTFSILGLAWVSLSLASSLPDVGAQNKRARSLDWNPEGAAKYLDDRMEFWFTKAKKLRTGDGKTSCVSCHMTIPYMLARPALRREMNVSEATSEETRLIEETAQRVETRGANQLLYDHDEKKKLESKGTEAVLNAVILASADAAQNRREPSVPTQRAFRQLWEAQRPDGAWDWLDFGLEPFETVDSVYYGATLAAIAAELSPGSPESRSTETKTGIERLHTYLKRNYSAQSLLHRTWILLASSRLNGLLSRAEREALVKELQARQGGDGGWSLASLGGWKWSKAAAPFRAPGETDSALLAQADGYATGLIVYALLRAGYPAQDPLIRKGLEWLKRNQGPIRLDQGEWTAWRAYSLNFDREHGGEKGEPWRRMFMSDTATAFAALAIASSE
jgi:squalene-hopene/tetraprenyl-beta-curcumene cyclase